MTASNTRECFKDCIGKKVVGVLFDALPWDRDELSKGSKTLLFDDGTALTIAANGTFWIDLPGEVRRAISKRLIMLDDIKKEISEVLSAAGALPR